VYQFLRNKVKVLPSKQQNKWCEVLELSHVAVFWTKLYENNYFSTLETSGGSSNGAVVLQHHQFD